MKTLILIIDEEGFIKSDFESETLFRKLVGSHIIHKDYFNSEIKPLLLEYGIKYVVYRDGRVAVSKVIIEAINLLEKVCCDNTRSSVFKNKAIELLREVI